MTLPRHHVVIGDGATAAEFAGTARLEAGDRLTVIGPQVAELGRGLAYADHAPDCAWRYAYLLNSPAAAVDPGFAEWMAARWGDVARCMTGRRPDWLRFGAEAIAAGDYEALFAPRALCGDYLRERTEAMLTELADRGVRIDRRAALATDLARQGGGFRITLAGGEALLADTVDVATGGPAVQRFGSDEGETAFGALYGNEEAIARLLTPGQEIVCLGANAAMLDVLRFAQSVLGEDGVRLTAITTSGLLPEPLIWTRPRRVPVPPAIEGSFDTADAFLTAIDAEIARFRAQGATMAELRPGFKAWITQVGLETLLPPLEERRKLGDRLERRFRRGTHDSISDFQRLRTAGQVRLVQGRVTRVWARGAGEVEIRLDAPGQEIIAPLVVNCTGAGDQRAFDLMTTGLIRNGWLSLQAETGGIAVGAGLEANLPGLRYLSPAVTEIGERVMPLPLYDLATLRDHVRRANRVP